MQKLFLFCPLVFLLISWNPIEFYISPNGNDLNSGTRDKPFNSIKKAQQTVREQLTNNQQNDITIWLDNGIYLIKDPLEFGPDDSGIGESIVHYKAMKDAHPIISGGIEITG